MPHCHYQNLILATEHGLHSFATYREAWDFVRELGLDPSAILHAKQLVRRDGLERTLERTIRILKAIPKGRKGESGSLQCPECQTGTIRWLRSSYNGHLHAACSTPNCFAVMQ